MAIAESAPPASPGQGAPPAPAYDRPGLRVAGIALVTLAALLVGLVLQVAVVGNLQHARAQANAYDQVRADLARGTVPVGQVDGDGVLVEPGRPIGVLEIPALGLSEVVLEGTASGITMHGVGHRRDSVYPGQVGTAVLFGRQFGYGGPFRDVESLTPGASIVVTTGQGTATYSVTAVRRAGDAQPVLAKGAGRLTLVSATGPDLAPTGLVRVDADLTSAAQPSGPRPLSSAAMSSAEKPLAGDSASWFSLVLWLEALLLATVGIVFAARRWGGAQAWIVGVPVLLALAVAAADSAMRLAPNLW